MSGRVKARAGRLAADLLGSATHAVTPDDPEGGLALGQETWESVVASSASAFMAKTVLQLKAAMRAATPAGAAAGGAAGGATPSESV
jgi:hypothetical protein